MSTRGPWLPLIIIVLAQLQMAINISALPVSLGPISRDLHAPVRAAATALPLYSLFVAAFVMLGAKVGKLAGERRVLQVSVVVHGIAMALRRARPGAQRTRRMRTVEEPFRSAPGHASLASASVSSTVHPLGTRSSAHTSRVSSSLRLA